MSDTSAYQRATATPYEPGFGDYVQLLKPRVMSLVVFTALVGLLVAPVSLHPVVAFTAILFIAVTYYGYQLMAQQIRFGERSPILQVGMYWATLPLVLGSALSIFGTVMAALRGQTDHNAFQEAVAGHQEDKK